jgi:hypothetical protein
MCGALLGAPLPAASAAPPRALTVRGMTNAYAEVSFAHAVRFETAASAAMRPRYDAKGTYAGAYIEPVRGDGPVAGTMLLRAMPGLSEVPFPVAREAWLPPGRYRVHLLGDAATVVKIWAHGLRRDTTVTTKAPSGVVAGWPSGAVAGVAAPVDRTIVPLRVQARTLTVVATSQESTGFYGRRDICVRKRTNGLSPCLEGNAGHGSYWGVVPLTWTLGNVAVFPPGALRPGEFEAEFFDAVVAAPYRVRRFVFTLN